jgi:hypothetical protein
VNEQERRRLWWIRQIVQEEVDGAVPTTDWPQGTLRFLLAQLDIALAEIERMRPVVEKATAYAHSPLPRRRYEVRQAAREYEEANCAC